ncbi:hypothetical protein B7494_g6960 [Chlorociboria aeruginascens]|nr:hypothetical protein B7494_g6960 [Chlorociboria aeruginascens]
MNGTTNGHSTPAAVANSNGQLNGSSTDLLPRIHEALQLIHSPHSSNESRKGAIIFLEEVKADDEAPYHGFTLAFDKSQLPVVRHYALSLLEHAIKHKWAEYSAEQAAALREWVLQLSQNISPDDPLYLRNKTAQLWVEIGKRSWAAEWIDMDELLVRLWELPGSVVHKEFVLFVLETLSDEVFNGDDTVAVLREGVLSKACVEIFTPAIVLAEAFPNRQVGTSVRYGEEGWLVRLGELLHQCLETDLRQNPQYQSCAVKTLTVYKSASVESLHALYCRSSFSDEEFLALVCPMYTSQSVDLLKKLFEWSDVDPSDVDDEKYLFAKKLSESRLIRYENMPEDTDDPSLKFLLEDIDTIPERHAFLGNYRRYSIQIIELIVRQKKSEAIYHILSRVDDSLQHLYHNEPPFSVGKYSKNSMPILRIDAHFTVVESALKGYMKWRSGHGSKPQQDEQERVNIENNLEAWCDRLLELQFEDPIIRKRTLQLVVAFSTTALDKKVSFMLKVLEHMLMSRLVEQPEHSAYSDAVKELQTDTAYEMQRLASKMPDQLLDVYDQLEAKVNEIISSGTLDMKRQVSYETFLFTIIHRTTKIDREIKLNKLNAFILPVLQSWQNRELESVISSFSGFCDLLGLNKALPLRTTKSFLGCSTEKVEKGSPTYKVSCALWRDSLPVILPNLLKFLSHAHAFHNPMNWTGLPTEMQSIVGRILADRFWQAGISEGSRDDFYARVSGTKSTMEGLASSIRGSVRAVREACYSILWCMSRLDMDFYGFSELPGPLAHALFADAHCLSSHQLISLLNVVRYMVDDCPVELRNHFIPPILATCFSSMDSKCSLEWEKLTHKQVVPTEVDNLTEEMKQESILRQLTHSAVMMIAAFLDPARSNSLGATKDASASGADSTPSSYYPSMRTFCLTSSTILEPLLMFLTHAIRMRDGRCCSVVLRVFRSIIPEFIPPNESPLCSTIREFISADVLKACISSLNEAYFVELHKDLAHAIASILIYYTPLTNTPRQILCSLPGIQEKSVDKCIDYVGRTGLQQRQQRALVLDLLRDLKGVSISEQGRITKSVPTARKERSKMQQEFMKEQPENKEPSPELEGVAGMFGP